MIRQARFVVLVAVLATALAIPTAGGSASAGASAKVAPRVLRDTGDGRTASFLAILSSNADVSGAASLPSKLAKGRFVYRTLTSHAARTQAPIKALLDRMGASYRSHWLVNLLKVTGDRSVVDALAARADVLRIDPLVRTKSPLLPDAPPIHSGPATPGTIEWGVQRVRAPQVWALGFTGQGIVLGNIDTGHQWDHPALKGHYRGWNGVSADHDYNWWDTIARSPAPIDPNGHGTHTVGTMIGDDGGANQIGVAPGAQWIGCRSMDASGLGDTDTYTTCFEFMIAPWDLNGDNPDPSKAPAAVSNSWYCSISLGECPSNGVLFRIVRNVRAAGIVPVVSAGNSGPSCQTIGIDGPPAQYDESYTVGASDIANNLASFSSRGPAFDPDEQIKPDIVAPGVSVRSSYPTNTYAILSGTSMASPHIAGSIALVYSAKPSLIGNVARTERLINRSARHVNSSECGSNGSYPNNLWGYGLVNAERAVRAP